MANRLPKTNQYPMLYYSLLLFAMQVFHISGIYPLSFIEQTTAIVQICATLRWVSLGLLDLWIIKALVSHRLIWGRATPLHVGFALFIVYALISCLYSKFPMLSLYRSLSLLMLYIAVWVVLWNHLDGIKEVYEVIDMVWIHTWIMFLSGMLLYVLAPGSYMVSGRLSVFSGKATGTGQYCAIFLPLAIWKYRWSTNEVKRVVNLVLVLALGVIMILAKARAAIISSILGLAFFAIVYRPRTGVKILLAAVLIFLLLFISPLYISVKRFAMGASELESLRDFGRRTHLWHRAVELFVQRPITGYGFATSDYVFLPAVTFKTTGFIPRVSVEGATLHSLYVQIIVDLGVIGLLFLLSFIVYILTIGRKIRKLGRGKLSELAIALQIICVIDVVSEVAHGLMYMVGAPLTLVFWVFAVVLVRIASDTRTRQQGYFSTVGK